MKMRMKTLVGAAMTSLVAGPAMAGEGAFFSLANINFITTLGFLLFLGVLVYYKVPHILAKQLDKRAENIQNDLNEARKLREEAQTILATYERKQKEVQEQAARIVEAAREESTAAAKAARADLKAAIERRLQAADGQIASAREAAVKEVRDQAISVAIAAARDVVAKQMTAAEGNRLIEAGIKDVEAKLH